MLARLAFSDSGVQELLVSSFERAYRTRITIIDRIWICPTWLRVDGTWRGAERDEEFITALHPHPVLCWLDDRTRSVFSEGTPSSLI